MPKPRFPKTEIIRYLERKYSAIENWSITPGRSQRMYIRASKYWQHNEKPGKWIPIGWLVRFQTWGVAGRTVEVVILDSDL